MRPWMLLAAIGCKGPDEGVIPEPVDYTAPGPFTAGTREFTALGPGGIELVAQAWYPSDDPAGSPVDYDDLLEGGATEGLTPSCAEPRPVVAFSHGLGGVRWQSPFLVEHLATHGYVVVAVDHPGSGLFDTDPNGLGEVAVRRPLDVAAAFDGLALELPDCVDPSAGYAVFGRSFGGFTAFAAAGAVVNDPTAGGDRVRLGDPRVWAAVALAPWDGAGAITDGTSEIEVPTLVIAAREDTTTPLSMVRGLWQPLTVTPRAFGIVDEAVHYSFSPVACTIETGDGCGPGFLDEASFTAIVRRAVTAFLTQRQDPLAELQVGMDEPGVTWQVEPAE